MIEKTDLKALSVSTIAAIISITLMTIGGELSESFKSFLVSIAGHHWIAKGIIAIALFAVTYLALSKLKTRAKKGFEAQKWGFRVAVTALASGALIFLFYAWEFLY
ncbi:MAG: hypothetical protein J4224_01240 [Candidatus Diapherotrites archaeon]|uniref:Uncharacterized protein n=1 Tax=Candidatus Iainarchaeum sp. TaxID=3101447 RepID=A0A7J4IWM9_9ARCH|nr:MAG: hypothetical protein QT03_C0001G0807 [archaeon GW2011_AR10]MBS3059030.1 hypothetical protein [Candidatus Diapherotrites archaeon]HIH08665.1 hypothetical protein [Candidatus Diapherotrites archaeon]